MSANAQVYANFSGLISQSSAVTFFQSTPRWPSASSIFQFSVAYLLPVALTATLPLIFALVVLVLLLIQVSIRFTRWNSKINTRIHRLRSSKRGALFLVPLSAALLIAVFVLTSLALIGNATLNHSANDALDIFTGLVNDLQRTGFAVVNTSIILRERLSNFNATRDASPSSSTLADVAGDLSRQTLQASQTFMLERYPDVRPLADVLNSLLGRVRDVFDIVRQIIFAVYSVVFVIVLLLLSGPPLLRIATATSVSRILSVISYLLYLFVPCILAWLLVGVLSAVGATVADVCSSLHIYRDVLMGSIKEDASSAKSNAFVTSGFVCPDGLPADSFKDQINSAAASILQSDLATSTVEVLLNTSANEIVDVARWTADELPQYLNCSAQIRFSGQLEFVSCSQYGLSSINGVYQLWLAFLGLSICLSVVCFASLMGLPVMRALDIWPSPPQNPQLDKNQGDTIDSDSTNQSGLPYDGEVFVNYAEDTYVDKDPVRRDTANRSY